MLSNIRPALTLLLLATALLGLAYPLAMTALGGLLFPTAARGSLIERNGTIVGSEFIGQSFDNPAYFWGRLSATGPGPFNAAASSGSNDGPSSPVLRDRVTARIAALRAADPGATGLIPADLATASASGLDPHISPAAADFQVPRVARARNMSPDSIRALVAKHTEGRQLGLLGEPRVNVLLLNLDLDANVAAAKANNLP